MRALGQADPAAPRCLAQSPVQGLGQNQAEAAKACTAHLQSCAGLLHAACCTLAMAKTPACCEAVGCP